MNQITFGIGSKMNREILRPDDCVYMLGSKVYNVLCVAAKMLGTGYDDKG